MKRSPDTENSWDRSGNLSFLNWLTIAPALACFDDASLANLFSRRTRSLALSLRAQQQLCADQNKKSFWCLLAFWRIDGDQRRGMWAVSSRSVRSLIQCGFGMMIVILSAPVVSNLMSKRQAMNRSFDPFKIVNTYVRIPCLLLHPTSIASSSSASSSSSILAFSSSSIPVSFFFSSSSSLLSVCFYVMISSPRSQSHIRLRHVLFRRDKYHGWASKSIIRLAGSVWERWQSSRRDCDTRDAAAIAC